MSTAPSSQLLRETLFGDYDLFVGRLPEDLAGYGREVFPELWNLRPLEQQLVRQPCTGRIIPLPRRHTALDKPYRFTGSVASAIPRDPAYDPFFDWARSIAPELNGTLVNWYVGNEYIGAHRDDTRDLVDGTPILTISLGGFRIFRLRAWKQRSLGFIDLDAPHGAVFLMPWATNLAVTHEIVKRATMQDPRISLTMRSYA